MPESRERAAIATLKKGLKQSLTRWRSPLSQIAAARGNPDCDPLRAWGHSPTGTYRLINSRASAADLAGEYGAHVLLFEPESGAALSAQAAGRVGLLVYGGPAGQDKRMRRTQGGVRLDNKMLQAVIGEAAHDDEIMLTIETLRRPHGGSSGKARRIPPLPASAAKAYPAPLDEMSLCSN